MDSQGWFKWGLLQTVLALIASMAVGAVLTALGVLGPAHLYFWKILLFCGLLVLIPVVPILLWYALDQSNTAPRMARNIATPIVALLGVAFGVWCCVVIFPASVSPLAVPHPEAAPSCGAGFICDHEGNIIGVTNSSPGPMVPHVVSQPTPTATVTAAGTTAPAVAPRSPASAPPPSRPTPSPSERPGGANVTPQSGITITVIHHSPRPSPGVVPTTTVGPNETAVYTYVVSAPNATPSATDKTAILTFQNTSGAMLENFCFWAWVGIDGDPQTPTPPQRAEVPRQDLPPNGGESVPLGQILASDRGTPPSAPMQWIYVYYSYNSGSNFIDRDRAFAFSQHFQGAPLDDLPGSANIGALKVFARRTCGNKNQ